MLYSNWLESRSYRSFRVMAPSFKNLVGQKFLKRPQYLNYLNIGHNGVSEGVETGGPKRYRLLPKKY